MSRRKSIVTAITEKFKLINGNSPYNTDIENAAFDKLFFWDETENFPSISVVAGPETRQYLPGGFKWGFLKLSVKLYTRGDNCQEQLELLLEDVETVIDANRVLVYDSINNYSTTEIDIVSINTDEGLLAPYGVGEVQIQIQYQIM